jgi:hypothetical protein
MWTTIFWYYSQVILKKHTKCGFATNRNGVPSSAEISATTTGSENIINSLPKISGRRGINTNYKVWDNPSEVCRYCVSGSIKSFQGPRHGST